MTRRDLTALPCSHPHCCSVGYLLRDDSGTWRDPLRLCIFATIALLGYLGLLVVAGAVGTWLWLV